MKYQFKKAAEKACIGFHPGSWLGMPRDRFQEKAPKMRDDQRLGVEAWPGQAGGSF